MYCKYCGKQIRDDSTFCEECGQQLECVKPQKKKKHPRKRKSKFMVLGVSSIITGVLLLVVGIVFVVVIMPAIKYDEAITLRNNKQFEEANAIFEELGDYKNSKSLIHHNYEIVESKEATCEENGYRIYKCKDCEDTYTRSIIGGHLFSQATCTEPQKCINCGKKKGSALGHTTDYAFCSLCGKKLFETKTYRGHGPGNVKNVTLPIGTYNVTFTHSGDWNFVVRFNQRLIVNEIGETSYVQQIESGGYSRPISNEYFNITSADGDWTITIEAIE